MAIEEEGVPWYYDIMKFLDLKVYPDIADKREHRSKRIMAMQYNLYGGQLYRRSYDGIHLRCLKKEEAKRVLEKSLSRDLWSSHEWENVSQKDPKDEILLEYNGN